MSVQAITDALIALECVTFEVRLQMPGGFRRTPKRVRVVVQAPNPVHLALLRHVVEHAGGTIEGNPASLGLGVRCPDGDVLSFSLPWEGNEELLSLGSGPRS